MKIFNHNISKKSKSIVFKPKSGKLGKTKYFPSFSKEWKNTVYCYNKNILKNIPANDVNINKIIKSYFNLYFKDYKFVGNKKFILLKRRRKILKRIYVSNAEIKHTNNKAIITLYTINREKNVLKRKYLAINRMVSKYLIRYCIRFYKHKIYKFYRELNKYKNEHIFIRDIISKKNFIQYKLDYLNKFLQLKHLYLRKIWSVIVRKYSRNFLKLRVLRKYDLLYSLNQYKFNNLKLLPVLNNVLGKIIGKKIEYNVINLKSIAQHPDIFTNIVSLKLRKKRINTLRSIHSIINRAPLAPLNSIIEKSIVKRNTDPYLENYKDLKILSHIMEHGANSTSNIDQLLNKIYHTNINNNNIANYNSKKEIHNIIFNSIRYKNMSGIKLEVSGRLTKRYRADRAVSYLQWKGGLRNIDASYKRISTVLFRGNAKSNVVYSFSKSKRRVGSFAVKGWIGTK